MKRMLFYALAGGLLIGSGCKKKADGSVEMMSPDEVAEQTQVVATQTVEKAEEVRQQVADKTREAVSMLTVKAEDVMGDLNQSVESLKEKVASFDQTQLQAYADKYKELITEKKDQIASLTEQIKAIPISDMMGEKTLALKEQLGKYTQQITALKERYTVYLDKLKDSGAEQSGDSP